MRILQYLFFFMIVISKDGFACSVKDNSSLEEKFARADHVLVARITSAQLIVDESVDEAWKREMVEATYELVELFKGDPQPALVRERVHNPGNCTMGLLVGNLYILFLTEPNRYAGWIGGSFVTWNLEGTRVTPILTELRELRDALQTTDK